MKFTLLNSYLANLEYVLLHEKRERFLDFGFLTAEIKKTLKPFFDDLLKINEHFALVGEVIKSEEFRRLLRSEEFQQIYDKSTSLSPFFHGGLDKLYGADFWNFLDNTKVYEDFINSTSIKRYRSHLDKLNRKESILLGNVFKIEWQKILFGFLRIDRIPYEIQLLTLSKSRKKNTISIKYYNKEFEFCATQVTEKEIKALLEKYLIDSSEKKRFIKDSLKYFKETKEILFSSADDEHRRFSLDCITTYILEFECSILNNYLHEKSQNTAFYKSHMEGNPLFKLDHLLLSTTLFEAIFTGPINPITGFFQHFWLEYLDKLNEDHSQQNEKEKQRKLKELLIKAKDLVDPNLETSNVVLQKKKLPCYNYLFAALLHEKARHTGDDFVRLCREAADTYIDRSVNYNRYCGHTEKFVYSRNYGGVPWRLSSERSMTLNSRQVPSN